MSKKDTSKQSSKETNKKDSLKNAKPINQEAEEQRRIKQKQIQDSINQQNMMKYLKNLEYSSNKEQQISKYGLQSIEKVAQSLESGSLLIPENSQPLPLKKPSPPKLSYQQQREIENKAKRQNMVKKIQYFYEQLRGQNHNGAKKDASLPTQFKQILSKQEHERRIRQIMQQKEQRQKRLQQLREQQQRKLKQEQQRLKQLRQAQDLKAKQQKKTKIQQNILKRKQIHQKIIQEQIRHQKERQALEKQPKLYQQMEQKYKSQILLPYLQEKKMKLKQLREFKKQYETDAVKQHEKQYLQKSLQRSREKKQTQSEWKYDPPAKTDRLARVLQQQEIMLKNQLQARKRRIQSMKQHQQLFKIDLKQKYKPKIDELKRKEVQDRCLQRPKKDTASAVQQRQIGKQYLQMAKKLNKSQSVKEGVLRSVHSSNSMLKLQTNNTSMQSKNHSHQFYQNMRRKKIEQIVNSQQNSTNDKYMMLKMQAQKIGVKLKQKEMFIKHEQDQQTRQDATELILSSIKAKMGIISLLKQKTQPQIKKS